MDDDLGLSDLLASLYGGDDTEDTEICILNIAVPLILTGNCCTYSYASLNI